MDTKELDCPQAYKNGYIYFKDLMILVNADVLIPRIETEQLVDLVIDFANKNNAENILEVGTGSGCISIALAKSTNAQIVATDISPKALNVAQTNTLLHKVQDKIAFIESDLLNTVHFYPEIIVANLPYIPRARIDSLDRSVKDFEPKLALDGGPDGFELYRKLLKQIKDKNIQPSLIAVEIDTEHSDIALAEAITNFPEYTHDITKDKYGYERFLVIKKN
jgi:release factor glutamine methyltransferase